MIGSRVTRVKPRPTSTLVCWALALLAGALGVLAPLPVLVMIALLPAAVGLSLLLSNDRRFLARFTADRIEIAHPAQSIPYRSLLEVRPVVPLGTARPRSFAIEVVHERGSLLVPATLSVASERVYTFLRGHIAETTPRALPAALDQYRREQEESFGADRVWSFGSRRGPFRHLGARFRAAGLGFVVAGAVWLLLPFLRKDEPGWFAAGGAAVVIGVVLIAAEADQRRRGASPSGRKANDSAIVITPLGLALHQGALDGHLTWQEIRKVTLRAKPGGLAASRQPYPAITLEVEGATIPITDSYDRPLSEIHERILRYWR